MKQTGPGTWQLNARRRIEARREEDRKWREHKDPAAAATAHLGEVLERIAATLERIAAAAERNPKRHVGL